MHLVLPVVIFLKFGSEIHGQRHIHKIIHVICNISRCAIPVFRQKYSKVIKISVAKANCQRFVTGNLQRQKIFSFMKRDFSKYAWRMRISTYGRTDSEVAQQSSGVQY